MRTLGCCLLFCLMLAVPISPLRAGQDAAPPPPCAAPEEFSTPDEPLVSVAAVIKHGKPINILAVGSATTVGEEGGHTPGAAPGTSFPYRMADALRTHLPDVQVHLAVRGGRGLTAEAMLPLIESALKEQHFDLVLWQVGTVEAVRGLRPDTMQETLQDGTQLVRDAGADVVLIDSQFSRFLRANADIDPYETVLQQVATLPGVVLFRRFDLMRSWVGEGRMDLERTQKADREKAIAQLNTCLGEALARFVLNGAGVGLK